MHRVLSAWATFQSIQEVNASLISSHMKFIHVKIQMIYKVLREQKANSFSIFHMNTVTVNQCFKNYLKLFILQQLVALAKQHLSFGLGS